MQKKVEDILLKIDYDILTNIKILEEEFGNLSSYKDDENQSLLHIFVDHKYDENKCFLAIQTLLQAGLSPNLQADFNYNFIQTALYTGYSENFILKIIEEALKYNLDVNHVDDDKDTIMHTAIYSDDYLGEIINIFKLLLENGFDTTKIDAEGRNLIEAMIYQKQYSESQIKELEELLLNPKKEENIENKVVNKSLEEELKEFERFVKIVNSDQYLIPPTIGREYVLKSFIVSLAQDKKNPLIVGENGIGKRAIVEELSYKIEMNDVPNFLKGKKIIELKIDEIVLSQDFANILSKLIGLFIKYDVILFIDDIHKIYDMRTCKESERYETIRVACSNIPNVKLIGTTTLENYYVNFNLKKDYEKILVKPLNKETLHKVINNLFHNYCEINGFMYYSEKEKNKMIDLVISTVTQYNMLSGENNLNLAAAIIDKAFAYAKYYNDNTIKLEHFNESVVYFNNNLILKKEKEKEVPKILKLFKK